MTRPATSSVRRRQIGLLIASTLIALSVAWAVYSEWRASRPFATVMVVDNSAEVLNILSQRAAPGDAASVTREYPPPLVREPLPEKVAKLLFPFVGRSAFDPYLFYTHEPSIDRVFPFAEHPDGEFRIQTNSLGMREAEEVRSDTPGLRVLVAGDSHTDGVCTNGESFASLTEVDLTAAGLDVEVLNCATFGYSLYQYLATLEHYLYLHPDVFIAVVYGGNDFYSMLTLQRYFERRGPPEYARPGLAERILADDPDGEHGVVAQELGQAQYFLDNPADVDVAVATASSISLEAAQIGADNGVQILFVYLPPPYRGQPEKKSADLQRYLALTGLDADDLRVSDQIADRWLAFLRERNIACLDLRPAIREASQSLYYRADHHLNVQGHRLARTLLTPAVEALLGD